MNPRVLGVIPARGGSKRIKRKNCRLLIGIPLIAYTIRAAQAATKLTDFVVSTDDQEIEDLALSYGARVIDQPMASDTSTSGEVCRYALDTMGDYDMVMCLHPTSPIRDPKHIDEAIDKLWASPFDTLASVCALPKKTHQNIKWMGDGVIHDELDGDKYILNASIYAMKRDWFLKNNKHTHSISVPLVMDRFHSLDVDEEIDLKIAELYLDALSTQRL